MTNIEKINRLKNIQLKAKNDNLTNSQVQQLFNEINDTLNGDPKDEQLLDSEDDSYHIMTADLINEYTHEFGFPDIHKKVQPYVQACYTVLLLKEHTTNFDFIVPSNVDVQSVASDLINDLSKRSKQKE